MKIKLIGLFLAFFLVLKGQTTITGFGNGDVAPFTTTFSDFSQTQTVTALGISGLDNGGSLYGSFSSVFIGTPANLTLLATQTTSLTTSFGIQLFDSSNNSVNYNSSWVVSASSVSYQLVFAGQDGGNSANFNGTATHMALTTGGLGGTLTVNLDNLSAAAIPEPATYAALFGAASLGLAFWCKRRKRS